MEIGEVGGTRLVYVFYPHRENEAVIRKTYNPLNISLVYKLKDEIFESIMSGKTRMPEIAFAQEEKAS